MKKIFLILVLLLTSCSNIPEEKGLIEIYFCLENNCENKLIEQALLSEKINCAFYDLNLNNLTQTLIEKKAEILVFEDNFKGVGISVKSEGLMHDKFCIFDKNVIMTGSFNPTYNGNFKNNNNIIFIESKTLANNYLKEFEELKTRKEQKTKETILKYNGFIIKNYFCPEDNCKQKVIKELKLAKKSIYFMTFSFTDKDIGNILITKNKEILVKGVMEKKRINMKYNLFNYLNQSRINVLTDNNPYTMHHKVFIIDEEIVITGSYNPTKNGDEKNDENILIIHDKNVAKEYLEEFERIA